MFRPTAGTARWACIGAKAFSIGTIVYRNLGCKPFAKAFPRVVETSGNFSTTSQLMKLSAESI